MKRGILFAAVLSLLFANALYAHDVWVAKGAEGLVVKYGHGDKLDPYKPTNVTEAKAYDMSGKEVPVTVKPQDTRAILNAAQDPALVAVVFSPGVYVKTPEGYKNVSKREAKDVIESTRSMTWNKNLWGWNDSFGKPLGGKMEIVPAKNPLSLKVGDALAFQVLYDGKPLAGATVSAEGVGKDTLKTDPNGRAQVVIKKTGLNVMKVNRKTATVKDPDADTLSETASIVFEVK